MNRDDLIDSSDGGDLGEYCAERNGIISKRAFVQALGCLLKAWLQIYNKHKEQALKPALLLSDMQFSKP